MAIYSIMKNTVRLTATIAEMAGDINKMTIDVPVSSKVDVAALIEGDDNPLFVVVEALNEGVSRNKINYTADVIREIAAQVNEKIPDAYEGHIREEDQPYAKPESKTLWIGATVKEIQGKIRMFIKGYVLPEAKGFKSYLSKAKAVNKKVAVSIYGKAMQEWNQVKKHYDILPATFNLESIDWARSGSEGVPGLGYLRLTKEMDAGENSRIELIQDLKTSELQEFNPTIISEMRSSMADEVREEVRSQVVSEMASTISRQQEEIEQLRKSEVNTYIDTKLGKLEKHAQGVVKRIVIAEMSSVDYTKENATIIIEKVIKSDEVKQVLEMSNVKVPEFREDNRGKQGRAYTIIS